MKYITKMLLAIMLCCFLITDVHAEAEGGNYHVVNINTDGTIDNIGDFKTYEQAKVSHTLLQSKYNNLGITYETTFISINYGVVAFPTTADCSVNTDYTMSENEEKGYINGCYSGDGAFLEYNPASDRVKFILGGVTGWADFDDVIIYPYETLPSTTSYTIKDDVLYHQIKADVREDGYASSLSLGMRPDDMKNDTTYYSYDTHYFYEHFHKMIDDYRRNTNTNAINADIPHYPYYQYVSHRTTSAYTNAEVEEYLQNTLMLQSVMTSYDTANPILTQSMLLQGQDAFWQYQNQFGVNAMMMLSLSMNESASGKSQLAYTRNNLFGHAAYDSDVEKNASRYTSVAASIYSHALHYMNESYLNPDNFTYHGGYLGNKAGGMNVSYASDPYWGEKAAHYYENMDQALGYKDRDRYTIGIGKREGIAIQKEASASSSTIYTTPKGYETSFILLEKIMNEEGIWYRVQSDPVLNKERQIDISAAYLYTDNYGYIEAKQLQHIINPNKMDEKTYVTITFDAGDGTFYPDNKQIIQQVETGNVAVITPPVKDHSEFSAWDETIEKATESKTYTATYKDVRDLIIKDKPKTEYAMKDTMDVSNGVLQVLYQDGTSKDILITTDMVSGFDSAVAGEQELTITYAGISIPFIITIQDHTEEISALQKRADEIIQTYYDATDLNQEAIMELTNFQRALQSYDLSILTHVQQFEIEKILQQNVDNYSVIIKDNTYDLQITGLHFALDQKDNWLSNLLPRTLVIKRGDQSSTDDKKRLTQVAQANHRTLVDTFTITGKDQLSSYNLKRNVRYSLKKPENNENKVFEIYQIKDDDIIRLDTQQSADRIQFNSDSTKPFALVSYSVSARVDGDNPSENYAQQYNGKNYIMQYIVLPCGILSISLILLGIYLWKKHKSHESTYETPYVDVQ